MNENPLVILIPAVLAGALIAALDIGRDTEYVLGTAAIALILGGFAFYEKVIQPRSRRHASR